jgi:hypothetical protein
VPLLHEPVVIFRGAGVETAAATVIESAAVADWGVDSESLAVTLKDDVPLAEGLPLMAPLVERANPAGREPEAKLQV